MNIQFIKSKQDEMSILQEWSKFPTVHKWIYIDDWNDYFTCVSNLPNYYLYSVYINNDLVAHIAAENIENYIALSIIVKPNMQGRGFGCEVVKAMILNSNFLFGNISGYKAGIFEGNTASKKCFEKCGFMYTKTADDGEMIFTYNLK